ncbi:MAG: hypothetical protein HY260_06140 [Chloroflexi bacterium]|nr:hypothetical protein [Chloroflexota bacterium]
MLRTFPIAMVIGPVAGSFFVRDALVTTTLLLLGKSALYYLLLLVTQFGPVGVIVGLYGWRVGPRANPSLWRKAVALYAVYTVFGVFYRVLEQYAVYMFSHIFWSLAIGMGTAHLLSVVSERRKGWLIAGLGLTIAAMPLYYGVLPGLVRSAGLADETFGIPQVGTGARDGLVYYLNPNKRGYDAPYKFGRETLANAPPRSVVIAEWYNDVDVALVLRYFQQIEHMRPDVEIVIWLLEEPTNFDSGIAVRRIEAELKNNRPVFIASLNDQFYDASSLKKKHCIVPEGNLYRVYPGSPEASAAQGLLCIK